MSVCPNCNQPLFPEDVYCGNCGSTVPGKAAPLAPPMAPVGSGPIACPVCGHLNEPGSTFCEMDGTPLTGAPAATPQMAPPPAVPQPTMAPTVAGTLVMPDNSEVILGQSSRVFGRSDLVRYMRGENAKEVSRAHFTISQEAGAFYLQDGGPDPANPQAWKPSVNGTSINGVALSPAAKQRLNSNDVIDVARLGLNITFRSR